MTQQKSCSACGESFLLEGVSVPGVYDGVLFWRCTVCGLRSHRWPYPHRLHALAVPYVTNGKAA